ILFFVKQDDFGNFQFKSKIATEA
ncbi:MAG: hypothetical protein RIS73_1933, partial [Bacteroidota bacterium]